MIALAHFRGDYETWDKPGEGPVTEADLAIDRMLRAELGAARPDYGWLSEESEGAPGGDRRDRVFIIDPIDGTLHFYLEDRGPYAVMLGLAERGEYEAGLVALPRERLFFCAVRGQGGLIARGASPPRRTCLAADGDRIRRILGP